MRFCTSPSWRDDDQQDATGRQSQELDLPEQRRAAWRHHHPGEMRQAGQHRGGGCEHLLRLARAQTALDPRGLLDLERLHLEQCVDEQAIAPWGRHPPRGGVRTRDQAELLEIGHHIADGRRRQVDAGMARQRARAHRLTVSDVALDQRLQQELCSLIHHARYCRQRAA